MEVCIVDACGGQFGSSHGSILVYEIEESDWWNDDGAFARTPSDTLTELKRLEDAGKATLKRTIEPDDVVTV